MERPVCFESSTLFFSYTRFFREPNASDKIQRSKQRNAGEKTEIINKTEGTLPSAKPGAYIDRHEGLSTLVNKLWSSRISKRKAPNHRIFLKQLKWREETHFRMNGQSFRQLRFEELSFRSPSFSLNFERGFPEEFLWIKRREMILHSWSSFSLFIIFIFQKEFPTVAHKK